VNEAAQSRRLLSRLLLASAVCAGLGLAPDSHAGNQKEEALADSVRVALSRAITDSAPPKVRIEDIDQRIRYLNWLGDMSERLKRRLPDRQVRIEFLETLWYEATRAGLAPDLVLGLVQVESAFRKYAVSHAGARGYMQVMPFWTRVIGDGDPAKLFHMQTNLRYGCSILRLYIDMERGDLFLALGRYNGSRGRPEYPNAVQAAWKQWETKRSEP
jgi:soluble lytic murein transglycosylase-like protein